MMIGKYLFLGLTALCFSLFLKAQPVILTPKWTAQSQFAGYYVAEHKGFFKDEGVNVKVQHPSISESSFSFLEKGRAQIVVMNLSQALTARASGAKVVNIMQTSQVNSLMLVSYSPLKNIADLQNKKIAVWNHLSQELLDQLAKRYSLNVEWVRFNSGINIFLSKAVDVCLVGSYNEYPQLSECGLDMNSFHALRLSDYGYELPEDGLYTTEEYYEQHKDVIPKIVKACIRGWEWANKHREETLNIVMEEVHKNNVGTNRYHQQKMLEEILRLQTNKDAAKRTFKLSEKNFNHAMDLLIPDEKKAMVDIKYQDFVK